MLAKTFISIDWGTSNFRMRLIDTATFDVIEVVESSKGVKTVYKEWQKEKGNRENFFLDFLKSQYLLFCNAIDETTNIVISGMASSSIGLRELPYANLPFSSNGKSLSIEKIKTSILKNPIYLVSGVKSDDDVIRGEEIQVLGLIAEQEQNNSELYILPGTHSKHIVVHNNKIVDFKTYMTGELFDVISKHTILKNSITIGALTKQEMISFKEGVLRSSKNNSLLNSLFKIRTQDLFGKKTSIENSYFLSGLLIGEELKTLQNTTYDVVKLCAGGNLFELYFQAIKLLNLTAEIEIIDKEIVDLSVIKGQYKILNAI